MIQNLTKNYTEILKNLGENPEREGLLRTPERAAKAMQFLTSGYEADLQNLINNAVFSSETDEMVIVRDIEFYSLCEHHLLPFYGQCHVAYLPQGKVIGLSKIPRIVDVFARRLQIQEQLTSQIAEAVQAATNAAGVAVIMNAQHFCMKMRGVQKQNASMITSVMLGALKDDAQARAEFLALVK